MVHKNLRIDYADAFFEKNYTIAGAGYFACGRTTGSHSLRRRSQLMSRPAVSGFFFSTATCTSRLYRIHLWMLLKIVLGIPFIGSSCVELPEVDLQYVAASPVGAPPAAIASVGLHS